MVFIVAVVVVLLLLVFGAFNTATGVLLVPSLLFAVFVDAIGPPLITIGFLAGRGGFFADAVVRLDDDDDDDVACLTLVTFVAAVLLVFVFGLFFVLT